MKRRDLLMSAAFFGVTGVVPVMASEKKILTAYFSRAAEMPTGADCVTHATPAVGNTVVVAKSIAGALGADLFEIRTTRDYPVLHRETPPMFWPTTSFLSGTRFGGIRNRW